MGTIEQAYLKKLQADPQQSVRVIIRTQTKPELNVAQVAAAGLTVTGTTNLIRSIAATGPAGAVIALAREDWVVSIEPDQEVRAL